MRWAFVWMFVAGTAAAEAVNETRRPPVEVAAVAAVEEAPDEAPVARALPPRAGFGGVPSAPPAVVEPIVDDGPVEAVWNPESPDVDVDPHTVVLDESDRCPDDPEQLDGADDDGCPEPVHTTVYQQDGRIITTTSSIKLIDDANIIIF